MGSTYCGAKLSRPWLSLLLLSFFSCLLSSVVYQNQEFSCTSQTCTDCLGSCDSCNQCNLCTFCFGFTDGPCAQCRHCGEDGDADQCVKTCELGKKTEACEKCLKDCQ